MKRTEQFNNLSEKLVKDLQEKVKKNLSGTGTVEFEILDIRQDPLNPGRLLIPASKNVPAIDRIYDIGDGQWKDIAFIDSVGTKGEIKFGRILFKIQNGGKITLSGNKARDVELYEYLILTNYRANKKSRDKGKIPIFKLVDEKADAAVEMAKRSKLREAMEVSGDMTDEEIKVFVASRGYDEDRDIGILRNEVEAFAVGDPDGFLKLSARKDLEMKAIVKKAIDKQIIAFNPAENKFTWHATGETICIVPRTTGADYIEGFVGFILSDKKGMAVYQEIKKLIGGGKDAKK